MKIVYLSRAYLPSEVSHTLSIMRVCQALADAGHDVTLIGRARLPDAPDPTAFYGLRGGFRIVRLYAEPTAEPKKKRMKLRRHLPPLPDIREISLMREGGRIIRELKPDIVYSRLTLYELLFVPRHVPIVFEMHSLGPLGSSFKGKVFRWLLRLKRFRRIIVTTDMLAEILREHISGIEVVVARLSAEPPVAIPPEELAKFRDANLQGKSFRQHVGYTGFLDRQDVRGTDIICKAASEMPDAAFHIVGGEPESVEYWRAFAKDWNRHGNLFFYGHRNPTEIPYFLACFDVVLAPLQFRPLPRAPFGRNMSPLKLPQYMAYAKAIVASDLRAHREVLRDGETALLVPPAEIPAWVAAVGKLLERADLREDMGRRARADYFAGFTPAQRVRRILEGI